QVLQRGDQVVADRGGGGDVDRGGEDVVGRLAGVDVVVGVDGPAQPLARQGGDHLVGVHVGRGAGPGLEDVDWEVVVPASGGVLVGRLRDGLGELRVQHSQLG